MATIYSRVKGKKITRIIAMHRSAQRAVDAVAVSRGAYAEALLRTRAVGESHSGVNEGHSRITVDKGDVDAYVILDDERGLHAALSIEYGRGPVERQTNEGHSYVISGHEGLYPLHDAFGLSKKR